jgi:hypothetical protein
MKLKFRRRIKDKFGIEFEQYERSVHIAVERREKRINLFFCALEQTRRRMRTKWHFAHKEIDSRPMRMSGIDQVSGDGRETLFVHSV